MVERGHVFGQPRLVETLRTARAHLAGVGAVAAPPAWQHARDATDAVLREQIKHLAIRGLHARDEVDPAFLQLAHVRFVVRGLVEAVRADQQFRPVHARRDLIRRRHHNNTGKRRYRCTNHFHAIMSFKTSLAWRMNEHTGNGTLDISGKHRVRHMVDAGIAIDEAIVDEFLQCRMQRR